MKLLRELSTLLESQEKYVVINNAGRGRQATWPSSEKPGLFSKSDAEKIVNDQNGKKNAFNSPPGGHSHWHAQPLSKALEYIDMGNKCYAPVRALQARMNDEEEE